MKHLPSQYMETMPEVDAAFVLPHPGEAEVYCGGLIAKLVRHGRKVAILDLTAGEAGSYTYLEQKLDEAQEVASLLGVSWRACVKLPDARIENTMMSRMTVTGEIKRMKASLVVGMAASPLHPDYAPGESLVRDSVFAAGLERLDDYLAPHKVARVIYALADSAVKPDFVVDITEDFEQKLAAVAKYTTIAKDSGALIETLTARARVLGEMIGVKYGEGFRTDGPLALDLP